ncbi:hypothetical protein PIROE2DRAFT_16765 [Piromyces sp. E2]|nr:hypothetical protein PIROE2DRAFT_16765 [Piromyces sp. E2]|eukprot:OUM58064.1 hypothetical protein PIROE2DRAFT_16765 [Piromyces sp. E2]
MKILNIIFLLSGIAFKYSKATVPIFNLESGFYKNSTLELEIKIDDPKAIIYYTLDGSIPSENSTLYEQPIILKDRSEEENILSAITKVDPARIDFKPEIKIKKGNVIRAIAKLSDGSFSTIVRGTYFVGLDRKALYGETPVISIITDPANLFDYEKGIYIMGKRYDDWVKEDPERVNAANYSKQGNYNYKGREHEVPASIEYFPFDDTVKGFNQDMGIRIMGAVSRSFIQKSFRVTNREEYGKKNLKYELIPNNIRSDGNGIVNKYKSFVLRNGGNDHKSTKIRDTVVHELSKNRGIETQQYDMVVAFIDGEFWGVYGLYEDYNDHYIANNYDIDNKNVIVVKNNRIESGEEMDLELFNTTANYILSKNLSHSKQYQKVSTMFDIEGFAWYTAVNAYIDNTDSILQGNNWAMWRARNPDHSIPEADGKWRMILFDNDASTGIFTDGNSYDKSTFVELMTSNETISKHIGINFTKSLLKNNQYKNLFVNALCDIRNIDFEPERAISIIDGLYNEINPIMKDHIERFGPQSYLSIADTHFSTEIGYLKTWYKGRHTVFMNYVQQIFKFKPAVSVTVTTNDFKKGTFKVNQGWKDFHETYTGEYFKENILHLTATPTKGKKFMYWIITNCKFANRKISTTKSTEKTIGIYPNKNCQMKAYFK